MNPHDPSRSAPEGPNFAESSELVMRLKNAWIEIISETNGITLEDTLVLMLRSYSIQKQPDLLKHLQEFYELLLKFQTDLIGIEQLMRHPAGVGLFEFFRSFPLPFRDEHTHLTGALSASFIFPRLQSLLSGPHKDLYEKKIKSVYGDASLPIKSQDDVTKLLELKDGERFSRYLSILMLPKLLMTDRQAHFDAAYLMAKELYEKYNVGFLRLKFTLSRASGDEAEQVPGLENVTEEDVVLGLYDGFMKYKSENRKFDFVLSPSFRKEADFYDQKKYPNKKESFLAQVKVLLELLDQHPQLEAYMRDVDTVGNEVELFRKTHFMEMKQGFRKLQYRGFKIRSHHGEIWKTLRKGIQAVDNAMNIWRIDTLEHGLSLGMNPNFYFHSLYQRVLKWNQRGEAIRPNTTDFNEINEMDWNHHTDVRDKLLIGQKLDTKEIRLFTKAKFHTAREVEIYQHDILNRMIDKGVTLVSLPSSNSKLTASFEDIKDHPFSWWEKKGVGLGIGTDNYVTLKTNFIEELMIVLFTDAQNLKITKLLMIATGEKRRPFLSHLLWEMRKSNKS